MEGVAGEHGDVTVTLDADVVLMSQDKRHCADDGEELPCWIETQELILLLLTDVGKENWLSEFAEAIYNGAVLEEVSAVRNGFTEGEL